MNHDPNTPPRHLAPQRTWADLVAESKTGPKLDAALSNLVDWTVTGIGRAGQRLSSFFQKIDQALEADPVEAKAIPERVALPVLETVAREDREELIDLWAQLMASAAKGKAVDGFFVDIVRRLDPDSARLLRVISDAWFRAAHKFKLPESPSKFGGMEFQVLEQRAKHVRAEISLALSDAELQRQAIARLLALGLIERDLQNLVPSLAGLQLLDLLGLKPPELDE